jgi:hypothetical protein
MYTMDESLRDAVANLVNYNYPSEERDAVENGQEGDPAHIFTDIQRLDARGSSRMRRAPVSKTTERGAETIRMPEGNGYAIAVWDEEYPDRILRHVALLAVDHRELLDETIHEHTEVVWRAAAPD